MTTATANPCMAHGSTAARRVTGTDPSVRAAGTRLPPRGRHAVDALALRPAVLGIETIGRGDGPTGRRDGKDALADG